MNTPTLQHLLLKQLVPSPMNPRKTFGQVKLEELARSIGQKGVLEPLLVRAIPARFPVRGGQEVRPPWISKPSATHEVIAGERRYRAATLAGIEAVPCIVRELDDVEVLEIMVIENLQRDDLHPMEEAQGYADLIKQASYDVGRIAESVGKSEKYVYDRVKLLQLVPELREVFLAGEITAGHAIILARLKPEDQKRCVGRGDGGNGYSGLSGDGLFAFEHTDEDLLSEGQVKRKAVSVRELQTWVDRNVRFRPDEVDLPNLFPETEIALQIAEEADLKIVKITHEYRVPDAAKDPSERTYGSAHWKRADGETVRPGPWSGKATKSKTCEHSRMGIVVAGPRRGESFLVCVDKKKCTTHWKKEQEAANQRGAPNGAGAKKGRDYWAEQDKKRVEQRAREDAERERWKKAAHDLAKAVAAAINVADPLTLFDLIDAELARWGDRKKVPTGLDLEGRVRRAALLLADRTIDRSYPSPENIAAWLKPLGIDAKKIVDQVAPRAPKEKKPKAEASSKNAKKTAAKKGGARSRRRAKAAKKEASADVVKELRCRVCGCTEADCSGCVERTGEPCLWVKEKAPNPRGPICSACVEG